DSGEDKTGVDEFIGTGPFKFEEWKQDQHILLTKNEDYNSVDMEADGLSGKKEAKVAELYFEFVTDSSTQLAGLESGEYDVVDTVPRDNAEQVEANPDLELYKTPGVPTNLI